LAQNNLARMLQGFLFADIREKATNIPMNGTAQTFSGVTQSDKTYTLGGGTVGSLFTAGDLAFATGFAQTANNGLKTVASSSATGTTGVVDESLADETPAAAAKLAKVGVVLDSATADVGVSGSWPKLSRASGTVDWTSFGLIPGEWVFIGGDAAGTKFTNAAN